MTTNVAHVQFHFDPLCPFAWRTALWIRNARKVRPIEVTWRFFSLEVVNRAPDTEPDYVNGAGWTALRTLAMVRRLHGNEGVEKLYIALGNAAHGRGKQLDRGTVEEAVEEAGLAERTGGSYFVTSALASEETILDVLKDHEEAAQRYHAFGVPTIALDGSDVGFYGPVIQNVPKGDEAGELWDFTAWALKYPNLFELKRDRSFVPSWDRISAED